MNVIILALTHVPSLRDYALLSVLDGKEPELLKRFAVLTRKIWNPRLFKSQVSPHEFLQEVGRASGGKFRLETQGDPAEFLSWLLNQLHRSMGGTKKRNSSANVVILLLGTNLSFLFKQASYSLPFKESSGQKYSKLL